MDFKKIESKWQKKWEKSKIFESDVDKKRPKFFTSNIIPYVNGNIHIGHSFTYTRVDAFARFKRLKGFNVCLAQGFHATGEPILGTVERLRKGDETQIKTFKMYGATDSDLKKFKKNGAEEVSKFWTKKIVQTMNLMGFSTDWRRKFTTAIDPGFSRFIEWQYDRLREMGYVTQGTHPVIWCPYDMSPTGDHDRLDGEGESPIEYTILKFRMGDLILPAATIRPETVYGATNMWLNPKGKYVKAKVGEEIWLLSEGAVGKLSDQLKDIEILSEIKVKDLLGKRVSNPVTGRDMPILPLDHVDPDTGTGVVMSVPAHAPWDWIGLENTFGKYNVSEGDVKPILVISTKDFGEVPAKYICEKMDITSVEQYEQLDKATSQLYKKEFHTGTMVVGELSGRKVSEIKDELIGVFVKSGISDSIWEMTGDVVCRCTTKCHVKILENQWFLKYSDKKWKTMVQDALNSMDILPPKARQNFENTINWLNDKACARRSGLGTKLPWDKDWIVETLSDSTIYMAYYTIAQVINREKISGTNLTDDVFDFIFLGKGSLASVSKKSGLAANMLTEMKEQFEYWYPVDLRSSAKDLVQNHLMFYLFHHTAFWGKDKWPKRIAVNGYVNVQGEKMSKSKGNIIPLVDLIEQYGADLTRVNIVASAEGLDDADWRDESIKSYKSRIEFLGGIISELKKSKGKSMGKAERYLQSKFERNKELVEKSFEDMEFRTGISAAIFDSTNLVKWYISQVGGIEKSNKEVLTSVIVDIVKILSPVMPHICEEYWSKLDGDGFVALAEWPVVDTTKINPEIEKEFDSIGKVLEDIRNVVKIVGEFERVYLYVLPKEFELFSDAKNMFESNIGKEVFVYSVSDKKKYDPNGKSAKAKPWKPGIYVE